MGNAALEVCRGLDDRGVIPQGTVGVARQTNSQRLAILVEGRAIPFDVTLLPVGENMRKPARATLIKHDFRHFLERHGWIPAEIGHR